MEEEKAKASAGEPIEGIEPGMPGNPVELTDPRMMRALAHPGRIAIWTHLGLHGPATATECAEIAGLSPSACSYHLRTLARYGFVEEDPDSAADGRERPWRARMLAFSLNDAPGTPAATRVASRLLVERSARSPRSSGRARACSSRRRTRSCRRCSTGSNSGPGTRCPPRPYRPARCWARLWVAPLSLVPGRRRPRSPWAGSPARSA